MSGKFLDLALGQRFLHVATIILWMHPSTYWVQKDKGLIMK